MGGSGLDEPNREVKDEQVCWEVEKGCELNRRPPRDPARVGSFAELRSHYTELWVLFDECKSSKGHTSEALRYRTTEVRSAKADLKKAQGEVVTLTKTELANQKSKSSAAYAGTAATALIIFYQVVEVSGGWGKWSPVFEHEAVFGVLQVIVGSLLAWALRPLH